MKRSIILLGIVSLFAFFSCKDLGSPLYTKTYLFSLNQNTGGIAKVDLGSGSVEFDWVKVGDSGTAVSIKIKGYTAYITRDDKLYALNLFNGRYKVLFQTDEGGGLQGLYLTDDGIYVAQGDFTNNIYNVFLISYDGEVKASVNLSYGPSGLVVVGDYVYVPVSVMSGWTYFPAKVYILSAEDLRVLKILDLTKKNPFGDDVVYAGKYIYVLTKGDYSSETGAITKIDPNTGDILGVVDVGGTPTGIYFSEEKNGLFITYGSSSWSLSTNEGVGFYDLSTDTVKISQDSPLYSGKVFDGACVNEEVGANPQIFGLPEADTGVPVITFGSGYNGTDIRIVDIDDYNKMKTVSANTTNTGWTACDYWYNY